MNVGQGELAKFRTYTYILSALLFINVWHPSIANLVHFTRSRMLYSLVMVMVTVILIMTFQIIKFATTVREGKYKKTIISYAAKIRYFSIVIALLFGAQVAICYFNVDIFFDRFFIFNEFLMVALILKYLTNLQREDYPDYNKQAAQAMGKKKKEPVEEEDPDKPKSRVGANKANKAAAKKRKKK